LENASVSNALFLKTDINNPHSNSTWIKIMTLSIERHQEQATFTLYASANITQSLQKSDSLKCRQRQWFIQGDLYLCYNSIDKRHTFFVCKVWRVVDCLAQLRKVAWPVLFQLFSSVGFCNPSPSIKFPQPTTQTPLLATKAHFFHRTFFFFLLLLCFFIPFFFFSSHQHCHWATCALYNDLERRTHGNYLLLSMVHLWILMTHNYHLHHCFGFS
jgi:hypothetical protein